MSAEVEFHAVRGPCGDATAEEVLVFRPNGQIQQQSNSDHRPIGRVALSDTLTGSAFVFQVEASVHLFHEASKPIQHCKTEGSIESAIFRDHGNVAPGLLETNVRRVTRRPKTARRRMLASRINPRFICGHCDATAGTPR